MRLQLRTFLAFVLLAFPAASALADRYTGTIKVFRNAGESAGFFANSYGYAVFPTVGKGGIGVSAAYGKGRVYRHGKYLGDTSLAQLNVGFQLGGQAYSQIVFLKDKRAFDEFTSGSFVFDAEASAVAITAEASTSGIAAGASGGMHATTTLGRYYKGMATFTVAKGGLIYEASIGGQKFSYTPS